MDSLKHIVFRKYKFPDTGALGTAHPTLNIEKENNSIYFLPLSSNIASYALYQNKMVIVKPDSINGLKRPSVVKLDHIFEEEPTGKHSIGYLNDLDFKVVIDKFHEKSLYKTCRCDNCSCSRYKHF